MKVETNVTYEIMSQLLATRRLRAELVVAKHLSHNLLDLHISHDPHHDRYARESQSSRTTSPKQQ